MRQSKPDYPPSFSFTYQIQGTKQVLNLTPKTVAMAKRKVLDQEHQGDEAEFNESSSAESSSDDDVFSSFEVARDSIQLTLA